MMPRVWPSRRDTAYVAILCALCLVVFFFRLGARPLWDVDEGMHAATSKEMVLTGDWVTPRLNGEPFFDKPPLFNWLAALSFTALGYTEFAARLPAALLGLATVLAAYALGRRMFGPTAGLLGGAVLATSAEVIMLSRVVVHDIALAFFISLALCCFYAAYESERHRRVNLLFFYIAMGFAVLAKGPIGLLLPAMIVGFFLLARGRLTFVNELGMAWGIPVFLLVAAPWYVLMGMRNPDYLSYFFLKQNLGNFLSTAQVRHPEPGYYYGPILFGGMFPWSLFLPMAVIRPWIKGLRTMDAGLLFLLIWFATVIVFFSAAGSKLGTYVLPAMPAAALLIGKLWHDLLAAPTGALRWGVAVSLAPAVPLLFAGAAALQMLPLSLKALQVHYGLHLHDAYGVWLALTGMPTIACVFLVAKQYWPAFCALVATMAVVIVVLLVSVVPAFDDFNSTKTLALKMDSILPAGERLVFFDALRDSALFYTKRRAIVIHEQQLPGYLASKKQVLCVIERQDYERLKPRIGTSAILAEEGDKLLIANRSTH